MVTSHLVHISPRYAVIYVCENSVLFPPRIYKQKSKLTLIILRTTSSSCIDLTYLILVIKRIGGGVGDPMVQMAGHCAVDFKATNSTIRVAA